MKPEKRKLKESWLETLRYQVKLLIFRKLHLEKQMRQLLNSLGLLAVSSLLWGCSTFSLFQITLVSITTLGAIIGFYFTPGGKK
jgi:hypothetical protein